jgi:DNA-binding CsgD family transcriptional regulator
MDDLRLSDQDLALLLDAAGRCGECCPPPVAAVEDVLDAVASLVGCDVAFWDWYHLRPGLDDHGIVSATRTSAPRQAPLGPWLDHLDEHPIMSGRHGPVTMISDVLDGSSLEETWLFQEALTPAGVASEIGMELSHDPDEMSVVVLSRGPGMPFDERDRMLLRLLRPHVDAAIRRVTRPVPQVTPRELQVVRLVRDGLTNAQVARRLGIAEATVAKHLEHVFSRTGARSRTQAVALCADLLDEPGA